jgi:hypothetical protein
MEKELPIYKCTVDEDVNSVLHENKIKKCSTSGCSYNKNSKRWIYGPGT